MTGNLSPRAALLVATAICTSAPLAGCATFLTSQKAENGIGRGAAIYHLPVSILEAKPANDGTATFSVTNYPDPNNAYTIDAESLLANYTLSIDLDDKGMLKKVALDAKNTDVASSGIGAAQALALEQVKAMVATEQARAAERSSQGQAPADEPKAAERSDMVTVLGPGYYTIRHRIDEDGLPTVELIEADFGADGQLQNRFPVVGLVPSAQQAGTVGAASLTVPNPVATTSGANFTWDIVASPAQRKVDGALVAAPPASGTIPLFIKPSGKTPAGTFTAYAPMSTRSGAYNMKLGFTTAAGNVVEVPAIGVTVP